ncbi:MAG: glutamine--tRNA ligase, partial [Methylococcaceae bacterium]|nr:glutamine--tRNA ligase [Methylococcaceae bacterium]
LFNVANPSSEDNFCDALNPHSLEIISTAKVESSLGQAELGSRFQFERVGYFCLDTEDSSARKLVFNRTVTLRDTWA